MDGWTLASVKAQNLQLEAHCEAPRCSRFYVFDLDALIAGVGGDYAIADIPPMRCEHCEGPLKVMLAAGPAAPGNAGTS